MNEETKTPEPIAAILAEMRDERIIRLDGADVTRCLLRNLADRIEAAAEREREDAAKTAFLTKCKVCEKIGPAAAPGNAAAMRKALVKLTDAVRNYFGWDDAPAVHDLDDSTAYFCAEMSAALAALAAPARNCDRFATADEAVAAFADHLRAWENEHGILSEYPDHPVQVPAGAFAWLFAPAEGKEADHAD